MTMEEKNQLVIEYITNIQKEFEKSGKRLSDDIVNSVIEKYTDSSKSFEEIKAEIDAFIEKRLEEIRKQFELIENMIFDVPKITDLDIDKKGITLNEQDIDLMMISSATTSSELESALNKITNIRFEIPDIEINEEQFQMLRQKVFDSYMESLSPKIDYLTNPKIRVGKKIEYLINSGVLNDEELQKLNQILEEKDENKVITELNNSFSKEKIHQIYQTMRDYSPIEKSGVIGTDLETFQRMFQEINNYNSLTIDEVAKYSNVALQDGTLDFRHLQKTLEFAKDNHQQVRLNTLLFYMDCPENLYNLPVTEENKTKVKEILSNYVEQITSFIKENEYEGTVRSIDVFNELLNRFALDVDTPYKYRGDIPQDLKVKDFDNIKSGWLKFLDIEDLCDVIAIARKNLPNTDFMYNDDNLVDTRKIPATTEILKRIRQYENEHGITLINSIGTQMHIDDSVTKEQIIDMFNNLSKYKLPIEITEFDMAMTKNIDGLTTDEINTIRMKKMAEIFEAISECKEIDNIKGFTIWSKTDAQNFRVSLANEQRIKNKQEPIKTLQGGFYKDNMSAKQLKFQNFNYHTHTYRSGHSEYVSDEEILKSVKEAGISMLGFSEHVPNPDLEIPDEDHRMLLSEVDEYVESINKLKEENREMTILAGFEAEFDPMKEDFLGEMREKVDYMILGQHFVKKGMEMVPPKGNPNYPIEYAEAVCKGIESGLFDMVAHPDIFMIYRDTISDENKALFEENCIKASHMICDKAHKLGIPIEINMGKAINNVFLSDGNLGYPHPLFWEIAAKYDVQVLKGIDAHDLKSFKNIDKGQRQIRSIEQIVKDKMIRESYNPVIARKNNTTLQEAYKSHQEQALTYETHMVSQIVDRALGNIGEESDSESIAAAIGTSLNGIMQRSTDGAENKEKSISEEISSIANSEDMSAHDKAAKLERKKQAVNETKKVLERQQQVLENVKNNTVSAMNMGCESKRDYSSVITQMTQHKSTKSESQKSRIEDNLSSFQNTKTEQKVNQQTIDKPKVLKKTNNNQSNNQSGGFTNVINLALIISFITVALFIIIYILIRK